MKKLLSLMPIIFYSLSYATTTVPKAIPLYQVQQFNDIRGQSAPQIEAHKKLYSGYVNKLNEITNTLPTVSRVNAGNKSYSPWRALQKGKTFTYNAKNLHELYFENISGQGPAIKPGMKSLLEHSFGSYNDWLADFKDCALCARGWVITGYSLDDKMVHNFVLDSHVEGVPVLVIPLLVFDAYEHAYMIQFGLDIQTYWDQFMKSINWDIVEGRINKWTKIL